MVAKHMCFEPAHRNPHMYLVILIKSAVSWVIILSSFLASCLFFSCLHLALFDQFFSPVYFYKLKLLMTYVHSVVSDSWFWETGHINMKIVVQNTISPQKRRSHHCLQQAWRLCSALRIDTQLPRGKTTERPAGVREWWRGRGSYSEGQQTIVSTSRLGADLVWHILRHGRLGSLAFTAQS